tara:strand:- start:4270 stop:4500 length:231 start_codon:yes stop_codon:yes gene_type:complete
MQADLLTSEDKQSYFINCKVKGEILEVGAVYIAPSSSSPMKLFTEDGVSLTVEIPENAVGQSIEMVAADTSFFIDS